MSEIKETKPVGLLYHGTRIDNIKSIEKQGLLPMKHKEVYLTADVVVAYTYAKQKGDNPVICVVDALQMYKDGFKFFHDYTNGEWTVSNVPSKYLLQIVVESYEELETIDQHTKEVLTKYY